MLKTQSDTILPSLTRVGGATPGYLAALRHRPADSLPAGSGTARRRHSRLRGSRGSAACPTISGPRRSVCPSPERNAALERDDHLSAVRMAAQHQVPGTIAQDVLAVGIVRQQDRRVARRATSGECAPRLDLVRPEVADPHQRNGASRAVGPASSDCAAVRCRRLRECARPAGGPGLPR